MKRVMNSTRGGFSLVELLIALTITAVIGVAMTGLFITQSRFLEIQQKTEAARGVTRSAMNVMMSEMRMIDADNGVTTAKDTAIVLRVPFAMGITCVAAANLLTFELLPVDSVMYAQGISAISAGQGGFAYRQAANDRYNYVSTTSTPTNATASVCTTTPSPGITQVSGGTFKAVVTTGTLDVDRGQPIILYQNIRYHFNASTTVSGRRGLFRTQAGVDEEIAAPFDTTARFNWYVSDSKTPTSTAPGTLSTLTGIDLVLNSVSEKPNSDGTYTMVPMRTAVFFKNRRD